MIRCAPGADCRGLKLERLWGGLSGGLHGSFMYSLVMHVEGSGKSIDECIWQLLGAPIAAADWASEVCF